MYLNHRISICFMAAVVMLTAGCDATNNASALQNDLVDSFWTFDRAEVSGVTIREAAYSSQKATIRFGERDVEADAYEVSGYNGCNAFSGLYQTSDDNEISFFRMVHSLRACREEEGRLEMVFNRVFENKARFGFEDGELVIEAPSADVKLFFFRITTLD